MNSITFSMVGFAKWCIKTIIAQMFEAGYDDGGTTCRAEKISKPDQEKGG